ncbi:MAG: hypothetical protein U0800_06405 [Isosphaeraceae bacterium]
MDDRTKIMLMRLRDEVYDCYIRSRSTIHLTACVHVGDPISPDFPDFPEGDGPEAVKIRLEIEKCWELNRVFWRSLIHAHTPHPLSMTTPSEIGVEHEIITVEEGPGHKHQEIRRRDEPDEYTDLEYFTLCFHSDTEDEAELNRFLEQSDAILQLAGPHLPGPHLPGIVTGGPLAALHEVGFQWPFLCMAIAWVDPGSLTYWNIINYDSLSLLDYANLRGNEDYRAAIEAGDILLNINPLADLRTFEAWSDRQLEMAPNDYFCTLSRDVRICSVSAIDALLAIPNLDSVLPHWDRGLRELRYRGVLCRKYGQKAPNQFTILDNFQRLGWPDSIPDPWRRPETLSITVKDMNRHLNTNCPMSFFIENNQVRWAGRSPG